MSATNRSRAASRRSRPTRIWLASFPRSGNTFLRCILHKCFGLPTTSVYGPRDLGRNRELERRVGHFALGSPPPCLAPDMPLLVKTHRRPADADPAIYIVRDGRAATVSLWEYERRRRPLRTLVGGDSPFGTWSSHVEAWRPWERPHTLLIRYEEMTDHIATVLSRLSTFLDAPILSHEPPDRSELAAIDGRWVRPYSDWRCKISARDLRLFNAINGEMMARLGYGSNTHDAPVSTAASPPGIRASAAFSRLETRCAVIYWRIRRELHPRERRRSKVLR